MEKRCPLCRAVMDEERLVCVHCTVDVISREYPRRETVLYRWGENLLLVLSLFFLAKGMFGVLDPAAVRRAGENLGLSPLSPTVYYCNVALSLGVGLLYAVSRLGGYLGKRWHRVSCFLTLGLFTAGEILVQFSGVRTVEEAARRSAVVLLWICVPVIQAVMLAMGREAGSGTKKGEEAPSTG